MKRKKKGKGPKPPDEDPDRESDCTTDSDSDSDSKSQNGWKRPKESSECQKCNETGHNERSHDFLCDALRCDKESHKVLMQHTEKCSDLRTCGQRGHVTAAHWTVCKQCGERGHASGKCGAVHNHGVGAHRDKVCGFNGHTRSNTPTCPFFQPTPKQ